MGMSRQRWDAYVHMACDTTRAPNDDAVMVFGWDDPLVGHHLGPESVVAMHLTEDEADQVYDLVREPMGDPKHREMVFMAVRVMWTNEPLPAPTMQSWLTVAVTRGRPAAFRVRRDEVDDAAWIIEPTAAPWFALATAGSLRKLLNGQDLGPIKVATDRRLFTPPSAGHRPPVDEQGRI